MEISFAFASTLVGIGLSLLDFHDLFKLAPKVITLFLRITLSRTFVRRIPLKFVMQTARIIASIN